MQPSHIDSDYDDLPSALLGNRHSSTSGDRVKQLKNIKARRSRTVLLKEEEQELIRQ